MKTLIGLFLVVVACCATAADKKPTVAALAARADEQDKAIMEAAKDIMKQSQDLQDLADALNVAMPKLINEVNDLQDRVDTLERLTHKVGGTQRQPEHNLDAYGKEAN
jgi:predicted outer membrane protein